ncbi:MAG: HNH endonuclease [Verrucomicrobia bacterium]|nr:HNH endonuclease [Verrucomicrobiota bacterium]
MTHELKNVPPKPDAPELQSGASLAAPSCSANAVRWLEMKEADWQRQQRKEWPSVRCVLDIMNDPEPPEWEQRDSEYQYRKGFYHGIAEAAELVSRLYKRGGYVRPQEIANILGDWTNDLRKWMSQSMSEQPLKWDGHPSLKWTPWPEVKKNVHERDEWACTRCGATTELDAHHIEAVRDGGLPELENLVTLCKTCHR